MIGRVIGRAIARKYGAQRLKVEALKRDLTFEQKDELKRLLAERGKKIRTAYLFFCLYGSHWAYLENWKRQAIFWVTVGGMFMWAAVDFFVLFEHVNYHNNKLAEALIEEAKRNCPRRETAEVAG